MGVINHAGSALGFLSGKVAGGGIEGGISGSNACDVVPHEVGKETGPGAMLVGKD